MSCHPPPLTSAQGGGINLFGPPPTSLFPVALSGAGSSTTEFGSHHPLLSHLLMKHGGHKDLPELASLTRIKRVTGVWATFAIDSLHRHPPAATPPPPAPPRGGPAMSPHTTEPARATGPPRPMPAVQRNTARHGGRNAVARPAYQGLVMGCPAAGHGQRRAINPAHA